jgi:hypothetical protein
MDEFQTMHAHFIENTNQKVQLFIKQTKTWQKEITN